MNEYDGNIFSFGVYKNLDATLQSYQERMTRWGKDLEREGKMPREWCIKDGKYQVIGTVDLRGMELKFPFGVVSGYFYCDPKYINTENYPDYIGEII